jgi:hypothetical protein
MNRCTSMAHSSTLRYFPDTLLMVCRARQEGIHPHLASSRNRFLDHGSVIMAPSHLISQNTADSDNRSHRLHCQADPHPRKQHPRWRLIVHAHPSIPNTTFFHFRIPLERHIIRLTICTALGENLGRLAPHIRHGVSQKRCTIRAQAKREFDNIQMQSLRSFLPYACACHALLECFLLFPTHLKASKSLVILINMPPKSESSTRNRT